jgi:hypothetical protein
LARFVKGDIVITSWTGQDGVPKRRPVLILATWEWADDQERHWDDYMTCMVTTKTGRDMHSIDLSDPKCIVNGALHYPSVARYTNISVKQDSDLTRKVCALSADKLDEVLTSLRNLLASPEKG